MSGSTGRDNHTGNFLYKNNNFLEWSASKFMNCTTIILKVITLYDSLLHLLPDALAAIVAINFHQRWVFFADFSQISINIHKMWQAFFASIPAPTLTIPWNLSE